MIYYVEGKLALCEKNLAVVDVNGVGFSVSTSMYTIGNIKTGEKVKLYTHTSSGKTIWNWWDLLPRRSFAALK